MARLEWHGDKVKAEVKKAAGEGLFEAAEYGLEMANRTVPLDEGPLSQSGHASIDREALIAHISYDTPYAVRQHEELTYRHAPGRRAKWLEKTMQEEHSTIENHIARKIRSTS